MKQRLKDEITQILHSVPIVKNLARKNFVSLFVLGMIQLRKVQFSELATVLNSEVKISSNQNRIEDFFREVRMNFDAVAHLMLCLLPKKVKLRLSIDRTEWDFGQCQVNILMVLVGYGDLQLPFYWELLDNKSGNSSSEDRIDLLEKCFAVLDKRRIGLVVGDREFVGHKWIKYLKDNNVPFLMRIPKHHTFMLENEVVRRVEELDLAVGATYSVCHAQLDGCWGSVWIKRLSPSDYLYLMGTVKVEYMGQLYRKRWSIEAFFQNLKQRGFDLESTHLRCLKKLSKLLALVSIAYACCACIGVYFHQKVQSIKRKKHGYKVNSFARHGLNLWRSLITLNSRQTPSISLVIWRLFRWLKRQLALNQIIILAG
jgi:hypothetical protein